MGNSQLSSGGTLGEEFKHRSSGGSVHMHDDVIHASSSASSSSPSLSFALRYHLYGAFTPPPDHAPSASSTAAIFPVSLIRLVYEYLWVPSHRFLVSSQQIQNMLHVYNYDTGELVHSSPPCPLPFGDRYHCYMVPVSASSSSLVYGTPEMAVPSWIGVVIHQHHAQPHHRIVYHYSVVNREWLEEKESDGTVLGCLYHNNQWISTPREPTRKPMPTGGAAMAGRTGDPKQAIYWIPSPPSSSNRKNNGCGNWLVQGGSADSDWYITASSPILLAAETKQRPVMNDATHKMDLLPLAITATTPIPQVYPLPPSSLHVKGAATNSSKDGKDTDADDGDDDDNKPQVHHLIHVDEDHVPYLYQWRLFNAQDRRRKQEPWGGARFNLNTGKWSVIPPPNIEATNQAIFVGTAPKRSAMITVDGFGILYLPHATNGPIQWLDTRASSPSSMRWITISHWALPGQSLGYTGVLSARVEWNVQPNNKDYEHNTWLAIGNMVGKGSSSSSSSGEKKSKKAATSADAGNEILTSTSHGLRLCLLVDLNGGGPGRRHHIWQASFDSLDHMIYYDGVPGHSTPPSGSIVTIHEPTTTPTTNMFGGDVVIARTMMHTSTNPTAQVVWRVTPLPWLNEAVMLT